jgi:beta-lactamase class A
MDETLPTVPIACRTAVRVVSAVVTTLLATALATGCTSTSATPGSSSDAAAPRTTTSSTKDPAPAPKTTHPPAPSPAQIRHKAAATVAALERKEPHGSISVAAVNTRTGQKFTAGQSSGMWTASAYKLFVLETLLLQQGAPLTGYQAQQAATMIENSDNTAAYSLFLSAGGNGALEAAARRFGMHHTVPGASDPTFTRTSASDYLILVRNLVDRHSPLTPAARRYALTLMADVEADQRWGVSAAADKHTQFYNKNGWLSVDDSNGPGETDDGRWAVTSVGIIKCHHQQLLMAVFTEHQPDMGTGVRLVEKLARAIAPAVLTS